MQQVKLGDELNPRSCIVTGEKLEKQHLIRFVVSPENEIVPDLKGKLPGRGVWVKANKKHVGEAIKKDHFSKALKMKVSASEGLGNLIEELLDKQAISALAIANKAGSLVTGFSKVDGAIRSGKVALLLHASDSAADGRRKLASATAFVDHMEGDKVLVRECWTIDQMSKSLGVGNAVHVAAIQSGATRNLIDAIDQLSNYQAN